MIRIRAILYALYYAIVPWYCYEETKHYTGTHWWHLKINLQMAWRWITFSETDSDHKFEDAVNDNK